MSANVTLILDSSQPSFPVPMMVAAWKVLYDYGQAGPNLEPDDSWRSASLSWRAQKTPGGPVVLQSVEVLCRVLTDASSWQVDHDPAFHDRNREWLVTDDQDGARLTAAALKEWDQTPPSQRESLLEEVDARVFGIVVAHGTGDD